MKWLIDDCNAEIDPNDTGEDDEYGKKLRELHTVIIKTTNDVLNFKYPG